MDNLNSGHAVFQLGGNTKFDWFFCKYFHGAGDFATPSAEYDFQDWNGREAQAASFSVVFAGPGGPGFQHMIEGVVSTKPELPIVPPLPVSSPHSHILQLKS
ncbi:hypothetical protein B0H14DRAFT_2598138 [Mycena olivaceomarginata]|nr:hypothetical protein B0H14DRAFT_2598138 [Mycena olivaceomarginata]